MPAVLILLDDPALLALAARAQEVLAAFRIPYELRVATPALRSLVLEAWVEAFTKNGGRVILCVAQSPQRLACSVSGMSELPVLLVASSDAAMQPALGPYASLGFGENGCKEAAHFACQILALTQSDLSQQLQLYRLSQSAKAQELDVQYRAHFPLGGEQHARDI